MKNKFLLLAGVAIMAYSSTSFADNTASNVATVNVDIEFVHPASVSKIDDMSLGKISPHYTGGNGGSPLVMIEGTLELDTDGEVTATNLNYYGGAQRGQIRVYDVYFSGAPYNKYVDTPNEITLTSDNLAGDHICGTLEDITLSEPVVVAGSPTVYIGGTFHVGSNSNLGNFEGSCTGSLTLTILQRIEEDSGEGE